jgi:hypothetical protein
MEIDEMPSRLDRLLLPSSETGRATRLKRSFG